MKKVLIVEDEVDIRDFLVINLKRYGFETLEANCGEEAIEIFKTEKNLDVILLDVMLPDTDGFNILKTIREANPSVGVIMLTARTQEIDKVKGLSLGADDYVVKPFSPSELIARIDALIRRMSTSSKKESNILVSDKFVMDLDSRKFYKDNKEIELTQIEFSIIQFFLENQNKALSRDAILNKVWGKNYFGDWKTVDVNISRLRQKVESDSSSPEFLITVRGYGYRWGKDKVK